MSYQKLSKTESPANTTRVSYLTKVPQLKHGQDEKRAAELDQLIDEAESGLRSILKAGFFLECLAEDLPKGQLGPWVEAHCKTRTWRTVQRWKAIAGGLGDAIGINLKKRLEYKLHEVLALPLNKVPEALKAVREKLDAEIAGKSYRQLFLELKQSDDGEKPKLGRLKGQGGASKEQRENAAERKERERLEDVECACQDFLKFADANCDDRHIGLINDKLFAEVSERAQLLVAYCNRVKQLRGGAK